MNPSWRFGLLCSQTGVTAKVETTQLNASVLAIEQINDAGGVAGRSIEPIICDPASNPKQFAVLAERLLSDGHARLLFGCYMSNTRKAVLPLVEAYRGLLFYPTLYEGFEYSKHCIYTGAAPNQNSMQLAKYLFGAYGKRFFFVGSNYVYPYESNHIMAELVRQVGGAVLDEIYVPLAPQIHDADAQLVEFNNGCLCCTVRGDLVETLGRLQERAGTLDGILIETTGLADPAPVASTFFAADEVKAGIRLDAFVTVVDAVNLEKNLTQSNEAMEQVAFSDIVLINKMDLVSAEQMAAVERRVRQLNAMARIYHTANSEIALAEILNVGAFDLVQKLEVDPEFLGDHEHEHDPAIGSFVLTERSPVDVNRLMSWMGGMAERQGDDLYRTKGIFHANGFQERLVFQSVRMLTTLRRDRLWEPGEEKMTQFVVIGKNLDGEEFAAGLASCVFR